MSTGLAAQFTRANSEYLSRASDASLQTGDISFTLFGWVYADTNPAPVAVIAAKSQDGSNQIEYQLARESGPNRFAFSLFPLGAGAYVQVIADNLGAVSNGTWYFIVAWHDSALNTINIQVNNGAANSAAHTSGAYGGTGSLNIGADAGLFTWNGRMQGIGFTKRVLTADEKTFLYNGAAGRDYSELTTAHKVSMVSWWPFNEESGPRLDSHGTNHLTDNNTVTSNPGLPVGAFSIAGAATVSFTGAAAVQQLLIEQALYHIMAADSGVSALVGTRVTPGFLSQTTEYPAIAYRLVGRDHIDCLGSAGDGAPSTGGNRGSTGLANSSFRFFCTAKGQRGPGVYADAKRVAERLRLCLGGYRGTVTDGLSQLSIFIQTIRPDGESDFYDDPTQTHQIISDFEVWASEQQPTP